MSVKVGIEKCLLSRLCPKLTAYITYENSFYFQYIKSAPIAFMR